MSGTRRNFNFFPTAGLALELTREPPLSAPCAPAGSGREEAEEGTF